MAKRLCPERILHTEHEWIDGARRWECPGFPIDPLHGLGDLAFVLGGSEDSYTGHLLRLIAKADPANRERLRAGYPRAVRAWELWMSMSPAPTAAEFLAALDGADEKGGTSGA